MLNNKNYYKWKKYVFSRLILKSIWCKNVHMRKIAENYNQAFIDMLKIHVNVVDSFSLESLVLLALVL